MIRSFFVHDADRHSLVQWDCMSVMWLYLLAQRCELISAFFLLFRPNKTEQQQQRSRKYQKQTNKHTRKFLRKQKMCNSFITYFQCDKVQCAPRWTSSCGSHAVHISMLSRIILLFLFTNFYFYFVFISYCSKKKRRRWKAAAATTTKTASALSQGEKVKLKNGAKENDIFSVNVKDNNGIHKKKKRKKII